MIAAAMQADIDLEADAQIRVELGGKRAIGGKPLLGIDQPDDARRRFAEYRQERPLVERVPGPCNRHRLAEQEIGRPEMLSAPRR